MKWTTQLPTLPGYYWMRETLDDYIRGPLIVDVSPQTETEVYYDICGSDSWNSARLPDADCPTVYQWYGPLSAPS